MVGVGKPGAALAASQSLPSVDTLTAALDLLRSIGGSDSTRELVEAMARERVALDEARAAHDGSAAQAADRRKSAELHEAKAIEQRQALADERATFETSQAEAAQRQSEAAARLDAQQKRLEAQAADVAAVDRKLRAAVDGLRRADYLEGAAP